VQLGLFNTYEEIGAGMIVWHPRGAMLRHILEEFEIEEHLKRGYELVKGPEILKTDLWKKSGHFENYRENMYFTEIDHQSTASTHNCCPRIYVRASEAIAISPRDTSNSDSSIGMSVPAFFMACCG
jgi:threonyl-tRNA synthetase